MRGRKSTVFLWWLAANIFVLGVVFVHAFVEGRNNTGALRERTNMVEKYELTDLCLFTDARYTRNPAVADLGTPFQDHPGSMEHFPSGSVIAPPAHVGPTVDPTMAAYSWAPGLRQRPSIPDSRAREHRDKGDNNN
jgi:hypothetical protein